MTGEDVKRILRDKGVSITELAEKLGTSPQNLGARFKVRYFKPEYLDEITQITGIQFIESKSDNELLSIIESQQRTIESLSRSLEAIIREK